MIFLLTSFTLFKDNHLALFKILDSGIYSKKQDTGEAWLFHQYCCPLIF